MKKLLYLLLFLPLLVRAQVDTAKYLTKQSNPPVRTDTTATNLLTYNQTTKRAELMSGLTLKSYFQNGLVSSSALGYKAISKTANYTITSSDFGTYKWLAVFLDAGSGSFTITLPSASTSAGYRIDIIRTDSSPTSTVTISGLSGINTLTSGAAKTCITNGTIWVNI